MAVRTATLSRRQRARIMRGVQYALLAAAILLLAWFADWAKIRKAFFDLEVVDAIFPQILTTYLLNTVTYTAAAFGFGLALGLVLAHAPVVRGAIPLGGQRLHRVLSRRTGA